MPTTITAEEPSRWRSVLMPTLATEAACRPRRVSASQAAIATARTTAPGQGSITHTASTAARSTKRRTFIRKRTAAFSSATGKGIDDVQAHRAPGRQRADEKADRRHQSDAEDPAVRA